MIKMKSLFIEKYSSYLSKLKILLDEYNIDIILPTETSDIETHLEGFYQNLQDLKLELSEERPYYIF